MVWRQASNIVERKPYCDISAFFLDLNLLIVNTLISVKEILGKIYGELS